ncbi:Kup system potassium uptake protein [Labilithrix luteola]|uniref:Probable potassium transport system protein Kup n=1 Tax=Labilithrix luteola TaxID=1391654 RepID=A0A0K1PU22_9BACT|nr:potassium transporter Kup [Labilithrix luteola]AKU96861.1 Kup system potassium uptake protein [Labilithrix luteola]
MSSAAEHAGEVTHAPKITGLADLSKLSLAALGVVYGDIGTSPLYALKECFSGEHGVEVNPQNVLGIVSLVFWSLTLVIVVKYMTFVMRADNHGEGGILALLALLKPKAGEKTLALRIYVMLGLFGAALLYGDGVITPAISVLSAVEGLGAGQPNEAAATKVTEATVEGFHAHLTFSEALSSKPVIVAITVVILVVLFLAQRRGTAKVGAVFGPTMLLWLVTIAGLGSSWIVKHPSILFAINPHYAARFFMAHGVHGFLILGAVVLCITGGEALYADMGHFGKKPIRAAWFFAVYPALLLCYFGQGALLLEKGNVDNPFYAMVSGMWRYPLVAIATLATIVASQALISGAFSLTQQAVQLGFWPRVTIRHTSGEAEGQIFIPEINTALMVACIALVITLQESSKLAAAYGIAVTGTMSITSLLFYGVVRRWGWSALASTALVGFFLIIDLSFFSANVNKIHEGGWFPLAVGVGVFTLMTTWHAGRVRLGESIRAATLPMTVFLEDLAMTKPHRVKGSAIFMTSNPDGAPPAMLHHFKHNKVLHEQVVLLSIQTRHVPELAPSARIEKIVDLGQGLYQVVAVYGFMQTPNVIEVLDLCRKAGLQTHAADTSFFLGRETLLITDRRGMATWRKQLFSFMSRNARPANAFFSIPSNRVVELGTQIEL